MPELWPAVLDDLAELTGAQGGLLFSARKALNWTASDSLREVFAAYVNEGWFAQCDRRVCLMSQTSPSFFVEHDFWSDRELDGKAIYRDFFRPRGLGWSASTGLQLTTGDNIVFSVERALDRGPLGPTEVERLNRLRPHLARSASVTARLGLHRAQGASETLGTLGIPALLIDGRGAVLDANAEAEALDEHVRWAAGDRVVLTDVRANTLLTDALARVGEPAADVPASFALRDAGDRPVLIAHVLPVRGSAHDVFGRGLALLTLSPVGAARPRSPELIRSLFDLTAAEARVAIGLTQGETLQDIAERGGVAMTTVRTQLRRVLEKTGCTRQAELVSLLATLPTVQDRDRKSEP